MRPVTVVVAAVVAAALLSVAPPGGAASCLDALEEQSNGFGIPELGRRLPVVLVHGWRSSATAWDGLISAVESAGADEFLAPVRFDYSAVNTEWVTDPDIGPKLGGWVDCLADVSAQQGGPGAVALVGHSMGGLAIREALGLDAARVDRVVFVGMLGTPNLGSPLGGDHVVDLNSMVTTLVGGVDDLLSQLLLESPAKTALLPGSSELEALPEVGGEFPVWAGAGNIVFETRVLFWTKRQPVGDGIVGKESATVAARADGGSGGDDVLRCPVNTTLEVFASIGEVVDHFLLPGFDVTANQFSLYAKDCVHTQLPHAGYFTDTLIAQLVGTESANRPPEQPRFVYQPEDVDWGNSPEVERVGDGFTGAPLFSGCSPGSSDTLPDGIWMGMVDAWDRGGLDFDLACYHGYILDDDCDCVFMAMTNQSPTVRRMLWADDAVGHPLEPTSGGQAAAVSVADLLGLRSPMGQPGEFGFGVPAVIYVNGGEVTEIAMIFWS